MGLKQNLREILTKNRAFAHIYRIYHEYAKYLYAMNKPKCRLREDLEIKSFNEGVQSFFGYYDKSPERNGHYLYHVVFSNNLSLKQTIAIYCDHQKIGETNSWNWQQGAMLSWLNDNEIIYNFFDGEAYRSKIINLLNKQERILSKPVYQVSKDGTFALTLNFTRLARLRPDYGYFNLPWDQITPLDVTDGIFRMDIAQNQSELIVSLNTLAHFEPEESMKNAWHKVNHIDISPDQSHCIFLHRWYDIDGKKRTRLILCDLKTFALRVLVSEEMVSHCTWRSNDEIVGYFRYQQKDAYYSINIHDGSIQYFYQDPLLCDDGHPGFTLDGKVMVTDTYPDYTCCSRLICVDQEQAKCSVLATLYSPRRYQNTTRCDLHPRWEENGERITFDSVYQGNRRMCCIYSIKGGRIHG